MDDTTQRRRDWVLPAGAGRFEGLQLEYLDRDDPDDRRILILAEHDGYHAAIQAGDEVVVDGEPMDPSLHVSMHELVTNQVWDDDPPETWQTAQRLVELGYERHEVLHMLAGVVADELWRTMHDQQPFDLDRFRAGLEALPESWEAQRPGARPAR